MSGSDSSTSRKSHFRFKKFAVAHANSTMKVGTDAVLLGAWADISNGKRLLDIGTGNGTIALMLAQRSDDDSKVDAVEIEKTDALLALDNFNQSPWPHKLQVHHSSIQEFHPDRKYDVIVTNPPYFNNSQSPPDEKRYQARHTIKLSHNDLTTAATRLMEADGKLSVILPFEEGNQFVTIARSKMLYCSRQFAFRTRHEKQIERWLLEFRKQPRALETGKIILYKNKTGEIWDDTYINLTRDFYLKL